MSNEPVACSRCSSPLFAGTVCSACGRRTEQEPAIKDAPAVIYLQVCDAEHCEVPFSEHEGATWCADKINDLDIEYVRADLVNDDTALLRQALEFCEFAWRDVPMNDYAFEKLEQTITALRERLGEKT